MVGEDGQLYTIEGVAAAILMVVTAYIILNSAYILTPGDTHISDLQLEQLGNDVLRMMDTSSSFDESASSIYEQKQSYLEQWLSSDSPEDPVNYDAFLEQFQSYAGDPSPKIDAKIFYRDGNTIKSYQLSPITSSAREHYVTVTRWIYLDNPAWDDAGDSQTVLLEVQLWRD